jgi:predicted nucleotidyltransferase
MEALELLQYRGARRLLETLLEFKGRQFTISELAKAAGVPFASTWRLIKQWRSAGIVDAGVVGRSIVVKLRDSEYVRRVAELLELSVTPQAFTAEALKKELKGRGVRKAYLFGSVARREEKLESDIDLAVLAGKRFDSNKLMFDIYERYGTKIVPLVFSNEKELDKFLKGKEAVRIYG